MHTALTEPHDDLLLRSINVGHHFDLLIPLFYGALIYTDGVDPEDNIPVGTADASEGGAEIDSDLERDTVDRDWCRDVGISPDITECVIVWTVIERNGEDLTLYVLGGIIGGFE